MVIDASEGLECDPGCPKRSPQAGHSARTLLPLRELCPGVEQAQREGSPPQRWISVRVLPQNLLASLERVTKSQRWLSSGVGTSCLNFLALHTLDIFCGMAGERASPCCWVAEGLGRFVRILKAAASTRFGDGPRYHPSCLVWFSQSLNMGMDPWVWAHPTVLGCAQCIHHQMHLHLSSRHYLSKILIFLAR